MKKLIPIGAGLALALTLFAPSAALADDTLAPPDATLSVETPAAGVQTPAEEEAPATEAYTAPPVEEEAVEESTYEVGMYLYKKLNADAPPNHENSGEQTLIATKLGTDYYTLVDFVLPTYVCGPGWAIQQDKVEHDGSFIWPVVLNGGTGIGWPPIYQAQHWNLEALYDVPACRTEVNPLNPQVTAGASGCVDGIWAAAQTYVYLPSITDGRWSLDGIDWFESLPQFPFPDTSELTVSFRTAEGPFYLGPLPEGWTEFDAGTYQITLTPIYVEPTDCTVVPPNQPAAAVSVPLTLAATGPEDVLPWLAAGLTLALTGVLAVIASIVYRRRQSETE